MVKRIPCRVVRSVPFGYENCARRYAQHVEVKRRKASDLSTSIISFKDSFKTFGLGGSSAYTYTSGLGKVSLDESPIGNLMDFCA